MNDKAKPLGKQKVLKNWITLSGAVISVGGIFAFVFLIFIADDVLTCRLVG